MNEPLINFVDVDFAFDPNSPVLSGCSLSISPGDRTALTGDNGSGKTTLLHLIVGLLQPDAGRIEAFGKVRSCEDDFHEVRRRAGLLFQDADDQLFCPTVAEDVAFGPMNMGVARDEVLSIVDETLDQLDLADYRHRITYKLSGGEKRLVSLAAVLAMRPDVLLLDEPTAGLDQKSKHRLIEVLAALPQSMLVVSHDAEFLEKTTSTRLTLQDGKIA